MEDLLEKHLDQVPIVVLDTETTGLYPRMGHRIVEIGAVRFEPKAKAPWQVCGEISQLIQPGRRMDPGASRVNGIYDQDLVGEPPFSSVANELLKLLDGALIVAHNATFDAGFLGMELYIRYLTEPEEFQPALPNPWLCTMRLARRHFFFGSNSLANVARRLGVRTGRTHRALNDAYTTAGVLRHLAPDLATMGLERVGDLLYAQGGAIYTPSPPQVNLPPLIQEALSNRQPLLIRYLGISGESERIIEPLYPTTHGDNDYLIAHCRTRNDQRTFRLDRILSADLVAR
jgi:DNA polymerase-3 subunit epsilon